MISGRDVTLLLVSTLMRLEAACGALKVGDDADARGGHCPLELEAAQAREVARRVIADVMEVGS